jgi:hypothetical protein
MEIKPIKTEKDYNQALERLETIFDAKLGSTEGDELEVLGILIDQYEKEHFPFGLPDPIEAIIFRMEQMGYNQNDLVTIKFRYKKPEEEKSIEMIETVANKVVPLEKSSADFKFSSSVAWFGLKLRESKLISNTNSKQIKQLAKEGLSNDEDGFKSEFIRLVSSVD